MNLQKESRKLKEINENEYRKKVGSFHVGLQRAGMKKRKGRKKKVEGKQKKEKCRPSNMRELHCILSFDGELC